MDRSYSLYTVKVSTQLELDLIYLPSLPVHLVNCTLTDCSCHHELLDNFTPQLVTCLHHCASQCFPCHSPSKSRQFLVGWKDPEGPHKLRDDGWLAVPFLGHCVTLKTYKKEVRNFCSSVKAETATSPA